MRACRPRCRHVAALLLVLVPACLGTLGADEETARNQDFRARSMLKKGIAYMDAGNHDQGLQLLGDVQRLFPDSPIRFEAAFALGNHHMGRRDFDAALSAYLTVRESEDVKQRAEAMYRGGLCHYEMNDFEQAFLTLRKVTVHFPWTVWANEAYYYIGLCHFRMGRWTRAVEALRMVGVSVPLNQGAGTAEAGQKLWIKVADRDLVIQLSEENGEIGVTAITTGGDRESITLGVNDREGTEYLGAIDTQPGVAVPGDGVLQVMGGESVTVEYIDKTTESGEHNRQIVAQARFVSTASIGITDGAYKELARSVFGAQPAFIRLRDLDFNRTPNVDSAIVRVFTRFKKPESELIDQDGRAITDRYEERDSLSVSLRERDATVGVFTGEIQPAMLPEATGNGEESPASIEDAVLHARVGDELVVEFEDAEHILGDSPRTVTFATLVLNDSRNDVEATQWVVKDFDLRARKNLIEAEILLRLAQIFKEVGLREKASAKADAGLERVEEVVNLAVTQNLDQDTVEQAFHTKWELLIVQDRLSEAVGVCNTLLKLFPASEIADKALLRIGTAKLSSDFPSDWQEAIRVFGSVHRIEKSDLKAEAQYRIAEARERIGYERQRRSANPQLSGQAIAAYRECAERWPDSAFAGLALERVVQFYIDTADYPRALEMMEMIFQDYQDAGFLDIMLLKWAIVAEKTGDRNLARRKLNELLAEYPDSKVVQTAIRFRNRISEIQPTADQL